jgi:hypothetical protein
MLYAQWQSVFYTCNMYSVMYKPNVPLFNMEPCIRVGDNQQTVESWQPSLLAEIPPSLSPSRLVVPHADGICWQQPAVPLCGADASNARQVLGCIYQRSLASGRLRE